MGRAAPAYPTARGAGLDGSWIERTAHAAAALVLGCLAALPATAATVSASFSVSATVVASCAIMPQRLLRDMRAAPVMRLSACTPTGSLPQIAADPAIVSLARDAATGLQVLTIEF